MVYRTILCLGYLRVLAKRRFRSLPTSFLIFSAFSIKDHASLASLPLIVLVLDFLVNHLIQGDTERPVVHFNDYGKIEKIRAYLERVESDANAYLSRITPEELSRIIERKFSDGTVVQLTVEDMLIHFFQEETHHRGEFIALLWQMNIEPPHLGWARYINS